VTKGTGPWTDGIAQGFCLPGQVAQLGARGERFDDEESRRPAARMAGDVLARQPEQRGVPRFGFDRRGRLGNGGRGRQHSRTVGRRRLRAVLASQPWWRMRTKRCGRTCSRKRLVPFTRDTVLQLAAISLLPVVPLLLTMVSLEELVKQLLKVVF